MLRLTVDKEDYIQINDNIRIVFLGGSKNHQKIMVDAPKSVNIVRGKVVKREADGEELEKLPDYFPMKKQER